MKKYIVLSRSERWVFVKWDGSHIGEPVDPKEFDGEADYQVSANKVKEN